jgi:hypothetical protein
MNYEATLGSGQVHNTGLIEAGSPQDRHRARASYWRTTSTSRKRVQYL